jgi:uncharacterized protein (TIGR03083 family)
VTASPVLPTTRSAPSAARTPALDRPTCGRLAAAEFDRTLRQLSALTPQEWAKPTDCAGWDVRAIASHVLAMAQMFSSFPQNARQHLPASRAARHGAVYIDALTARQVNDRRSLTASDICQKLAAVAPRAVRWRQGTPSLMRRRPMPGLQPVGSTPGAPVEAWTFGYLFDVILTRDTWMHRVDVARATRRQLELSSDHDGVLIADVVAEWSGRHAEPYTLTLTGPAGGRWSRGQNSGHVLELDAVEFARTLSGRGSAEGLLAVAVPF